MNGWLGSFNTAGLDPLFWLHHSNIDRLWEVWLNLDPQLTNPTDAAWLKGPAQEFLFHDANGSVVALSPGDVADTRAGMLLYEYEDISNPMAQAGLAAVAVISPPDQTSLAGASDVNVSLSSSPTSVKVPLDPSVADTAALGGTPQTFLNLENVSGIDNAASYNVFLNVEGTAALSESHFAGLLPMFGVAEASRADADHGGSGLNFVLDISELVQTLKASGDWNGQSLSVTFVPKRKSERAPDIKVGRVSVYVG